jgi:hypothetical protein
VIWHACALPASDARASRSLLMPVAAGMLEPQCTRGRRIQTSKAAHRFGVALELELGLRDLELKRLLHLACSEPRAPTEQLSSTRQAGCALLRLLLRLLFLAQK